MRTVKCPSCSRAKSRGGSGKTSTNGVKGDVSDDAIITSGPRSGWTAENCESYFLGPLAQLAPGAKGGRHAQLYDWRHVPALPRTHGSLDGRPSGPGSRQKQERQP